MTDQFNPKEKLERIISASFNLLPDNLGIDGRRIKPLSEAIIDALLPDMISSKPAHSPAVAQDIITKYVADLNPSEEPSKKDDLELIEKAINTVLRREKVPLLILGSEEFKESASGYLVEHGFMPLIAEDDDDAVKSAAEQRKIIVVGEDGRVSEDILKKLQERKNNLNVIYAREDNLEKDARIIEEIDDTIERITDPVYLDRKYRNEENPDIAFVTDNPDMIRGLISALNSRGIPTISCQTHEEAEVMYSTARVINVGEDFPVETALQFGIDILLNQNEYTPETIHEFLDGMSSQKNASRLLEESKGSTRRMAKKVIKSRNPASRDVLLIDDSGDGLVEKIAEAFSEKGFHVMTSSSEKSISYFAVNQKIDITSLSQSQKMTIAEEAARIETSSEDLEMVISSIEKGNDDDEDFTQLFYHIRNLNKSWTEKTIMWMYCLYSGNMNSVIRHAEKRIKDLRIYYFSSDENVKAEELPPLNFVDMKKIVKDIASRNQLQFYLNKGTSEDLHNALMAKAFNMTKDFLQRKSPYKVKEYFLNEEFMDYVLKSLIGYHKGGESGFRDNVLTEDQLENLKASVISQLNLKNDEDLDRAILHLSRYFEGENGESRRVYHSLEFDEIRKALGGDEGIPGAEETRKKIADKIKRNVRRYLNDKDLGPKDWANLVTREYRIEHPGKNPVFRVDIDFLRIKGISSIVKIFDYRGLSASSISQKREEFQREIRASDYFTRRGINKAEHFFFEEYENFSVIMMRCWGHNNVYDNIYEINSLIEHEKRRENTDTSLIDRWVKRKERILTGLMKKIAEVHVFSPSDFDNSLIDEKERITLPKDEFSKSLEDVFAKKSRRKDLLSTYLGSPFIDSEQQDLAEEFESILGSLREKSSAFADYLENSRFLKEIVACKDSALRNWITFGFRSIIKKDYLRPIDFGTIQARPIQTDFGNVFVIGDLIDEDKIEGYARTYFESYFKSIDVHNKYVRGVASNFEKAVRKQLNITSLCRKKARRFLKGVKKDIPSLSEYVSGYVKDAMKQYKKDHIEKKQRFQRIDENGRINQDIIFAMNEAFDRYISEETSDNPDKKNYISEGEKLYLRNFMDNTVRYFQSLKIKDDYMYGEKEKRKSEFFEGFVESLYASMAFKSLRNIRAFTKTMIEGINSVNPLDQLREIRRMTEKGVVRNLEKFLQIYKEKADAQESEKEYNYTLESYAQLLEMKDHLAGMGDCYRKLEQRLSG